MWRNLVQIFFPYFCNYRIIKIIIPHLLSNKSPNIYLLSNTLDLGIRDGYSNSTHVVFSHDGKWDCNISQKVQMWTYQYQNFPFCCNKSVLPPSVFKAWLRDVSFLFWLIKFSFRKKQRRSNTQDMLRGLELVMGHDIIQRCTLFFFFFSHTK